jgi:hypothetical protein
MRPVGDARVVANLLDARDIAFDAIHVDDKSRCSILTSDLLSERCLQDQFFPGARTNIVNA